ncbi:MAG: hypothetical protein SWZ49_29335 [Cyanobacteriota bacterium]|nr:hypothetical protein [Cyanobacteriota bacterium]
MEIKQKIATFLRDELKLELSDEKTLVPRMSNEVAKFLGYEIHILHADDKHDHRGQRCINGSVASTLTITRAVVDSTLSKNGQKLSLQEVEKTQNSIERVQIYSAAAQDEVVTQNVMKRIAQQNTSTTAILGAMRADGLKSKQS